MKKIKLILLAFTATLYVGCQDAIDIVQPSELDSDRTYETVDDLELGLIGAYGNLPGESQIYFTSLFTDEVSIGRNNGGQGRGGELAFLLNNTSGDAAGIWVGNYSAINLANRLIAGAENVIINEVDPAVQTALEVRKKNVLAQAYGIRAFAHLQLMTYFAPDMKDDSGLGVIALDFVPASNAQLQRNTAGEVFSLIESDLAFTEANVSVNTSKIYIGPSFVYAMRARMAAYRGKYDIAKTNVDLLDATFNLTAGAAYGAIWLDQEPPVAGGGEVIFKLERGRGTTGNFAQFWSSVNSTVGGSPFLEVGRSLFNLVNDPNDSRRFILVDPTAIIAPNYQALSYADYINQDVLPVGKYSITESQNLLADIKVFRMSEMVLIRAEYFASINDFQGVADQINSIRTARSVNGALTPIAVPLNAQQAWASILKERRAELALEGHRYIDLKRLGVLAGVAVERDPQDCSFNGSCTLPTTDYRFTLPIPLDELNANPTIQQNPQY